VDFLQCPDASSHNYRDTNGSNRCAGKKIQTDGLMQLGKYYPCVTWKFRFDFHAFQLLFVHEIVLYRTLFPIVISTDFCKEE